MSIRGHGHGDKVAVGSVTGWLLKVEPLNMHFLSIVQQQLIISGAPGGHCQWSTSSVLLPWVPPTHPQGPSLDT